jgi:hypothetical protein
MHTGLPMDNKQLVGVVSDAAGGWSSEAARGGGGCGAPADAGREQGALCRTPRGAKPGVCNYAFYITVTTCKLPCSLQSLLLLPL